MTLTNLEKPFQYLLLLFYGDAKVVFYFFKKYHLKLLDILKHTLV